MCKGLSCRCLWVDTFFSVTEIQTYCKHFYSLLCPYNNSCGAALPVPGRRRTAPAGEEGCGKGASERGGEGRERRKRH